MGSIKKTETGSVLNFNTYLPKTLDETKISFTPKQNGSGTPSPENVREIVGKNGITVWQSGKNLVPPSTDTSFWTIGWLNTNGTVSASNNPYLTSDFIKVKGGDTYALQVYDPTETQLPSAWKCYGFYDSDQVFISDAYHGSTSTSASSVVVPDNAKYMRISFTSGNRNTGVTYLSQLEFGSEATAYEPYSTTVETSVSFPAVGKNLLDFSTAEVVNNNVIFGGTNDNTVPNGTLFLSAGTYTLSASATMVMMQITEADGTIMNALPFSKSCKYLIEKSQAVRVLFVGSVSSDMTTFQYQLEKGSTATDYEPFDNTIYGGYIDLVNGEVVAEWTKVDMGDLKWLSGWGTYYVQPSDHKNNGSSGTPAEIICDIYPSDINYPASQVGNIDKNIRGRADYVQICIRDDDYATAADFKTAVTGHYLAYKLAEPIHYPISPRILTTLRGNNVMWSDGDSLTISYTDDVVNTYDFRRHISLDTPHKASASGAVASFGTDMVGKMKCKIHFSPKQEGSGTPSPDNVRNISGRSSVKLWQSGKNIFGGWQVASLLGYTENNIHEDENGQYVSIGTKNEVAFPEGIFKENTQYTFIVKSYANSPLNSVKNFRIHYTDGTVTDVSSPNWVGTVAVTTNASKTIRGISIINRSITRYFYFEESGFFEGVCTVDDFEPYKGLNEITFTFPSTVGDNGVVYGGYVDAENGEVVAEYAEKVITGDENWQLSTWTGNNGVYLTHRETSYDTAVIPFMAGQSYSNMLMDGGLGYYNRPDGSFGITGAGTVPNYTYLFINNTAWGTTVEEYKAKLKELYEAGTPLTIVAPLKTAYVQHYSLTPQSIATLRGSNRIWSDGDSVEVEYYKHTDEPQEYIPAEVLGTGNIAIVTSDGYLIGEEQDYIKY